MQVSDLAPFIRSINAKDVQPMLDALAARLENLVTIGLGYTQWSTAVIYLMMLLVLLFRPRGLFGERIQRFE